MTELKRYKASGHYSDGECDRGEWVKHTDAEAALAERDKRINELRRALMVIQKEADFQEHWMIKALCEEALEGKK